MKKMIAFIFYFLLVMPVWSAQSPTTSNLVKAGGYGGNKRSGQLIYSGTATTLAALDVTHDPNTHTCYLENSEAIVKDGNTKEIITFDCKDPDPNHHNLYWDGYLGSVNGGYSPENDALYAGHIATRMFRDWYGIPPLKDETGNLLPIIFKLHAHMDNASWNGNEIIVGDGINAYYPLTSISALSYMIGSLFTAQHSNLNSGLNEEGGINVAFSCMTAMAVEFYLTGKNSWQVGAEITKNGVPLHYMDIPSKNCGGKKPGDACDIDTLAEYKNKMLDFYSSGLFNRAFYLLATSNNWDTRKAYNIFIRANQFHWQRGITFHQAACDVVVSAKELDYETMPVMRAFSGVGIDTRDCQIK